MIYIIHPDSDIWNYVLRGIDKKADCILRPLNRYCYKWQRVVRKLFSSMHINGSLLFKPSLIKEIEMLSENDIFIICDYSNMCLLHAIADIIRPEARRFFWIWNPVKLDQVDYFKKTFAEMEKDGFAISTFDPSDAKRFNMLLFSQFFNMKRVDINQPIVYDFYFIGYEKGRSKQLEELKEMLKYYNVFFKVVRSTKECIPYEENISNVVKSRCLVDIVQDGQDGMTLRPLEALAFRKKLITNNKNLKDADFYHPQNIFILGLDSIENIDYFIYSDWNAIDEHIIQKYDVNSWVNHFRQI